MNSKRLGDLFKSVLSLAKLGASLTKTHITPDEKRAIKQIKALIRAVQEVKK